MGALSIALAVLAVAGAALTVLDPDLRRGGLALAATNLLLGLLALSLGAVDVFAVEVVAALLAAGLIQGIDLRRGERRLWPPQPALAAPAAVSILVLGGLALVALQPGWRSAPLTASPAALIPPEQLVPVGMAILLVLMGALAVVTLRLPRRPHPVEPSPPRRATPAGVRSPRDRGRR